MGNATGEREKCHDVMEWIWTRHELATGAVEVRRTLCFS